MMLRWIWACLALLLLATAPAGAQDFPKFTGLVVDAANVIPDDQEAALRAKLETLQQQGKHQLVVATVPDLQGYAIEDYGYRLGRAWGVGLKGADNGAILLVAPNERKVRIEVGSGLEGIVTDAFSSVVINQQIVPRFRAGDMPGGIVAGADALAQQLSLPDDDARVRAAKAAGEYDAAHKRTSSRHGGGFPISLVFWGIVFLVMILPILRGGRRGRKYRGVRQGVADNLPIILWSIANEIGNQSRHGGGGNDWSGGGWGGGSSGGSDGSWGGGGFTGGGGGSFGGGGASGSW